MSHSQWWPLSCHVHLHILRAVGRLLGEVLSNCCCQFLAFLRKSPSSPSCFLWGHEETGFIDWIWSKRRHSPELGKADRLASLQGTMCCSCQNPCGETTPADLSAGEVLCELWQWGQPLGRQGLCCSLHPSLGQGQERSWAVSLNLPCAAPGETPPLKTAFPDSVCNTPTRKTGNAAYGRSAASSHHAATNLLTGRKLSNLAIKVLKTDLIKYPSLLRPCQVCLNYTFYIPILCYKFLLF